MKLLLDTCTFLWACAEPARLASNARDLIRSPEHQVYLSAASAWEMATKHALGRLVLDESPARLIPQLRRQHGVESLAVDEESVLHTARLPWLHKDPFDRLLVCQAIVHGMTLVTPDPLVAQYPARVIW